VPAVTDLIMAWGRGWARSRHTPDPVPFASGFRIDVGDPGHRVRHVLHTWDEEYLRDLGRTLDAPGSWIKAAGDPELFRAALPGWTMDSAGYLMTAPFTPGLVEPPAPYALEVHTTGPVSVAVVRAPDGEVAASARLALIPGYGIVDRVSTAEGHRRRGLGTVVMRALADHAAAAGVPTGILCATDDGRALYTRLGWTVRSDVPGAYRPEH
jgi:GNAT superfamily N-acetyltransferase